MAAERMKRKNSLALALAVGFTMLIGAAGPPARARQEDAPDRIVYSSRSCPDNSSPDCTFEIYSVGLDGGTPTQILSTYGTDDVFPAVSPDGSEIAFNSWNKAPTPYGGCDSHLWLMGADGSTPRMISSPVHAWDETFGWSPDGNEIVFTRWPNGPTCEYGAGPAGTGPEEGHGDVYLLTRDGEVWLQEPLLTRPGSEKAPMYSPDGRLIAYSYDRDDNGAYEEGETQQEDIWVVRADGTGHKRLTWTRWIAERSPAWSPNGRWIAFHRGTGGAGDGYQSGWGRIWIMRADGSEKRALTPRGSLDETPAWSPDGSMIAFTRCHPIARRYDCAIAVISLADPERVRIIADGGDMDVHPFWQPAG